MHHIQKLVAASALLGASSMASTAVQAQHAHEHGRGSLEIAVEGEHLHLRLTLPGADTVGFEHSARSTEETHAIEEALKTLEDWPSIFQFPDSAGCSLETGEARTDQLADGHHHEDHGHEQHDEHAHEEHEEHDEHGHDEHEHEEAEETHASFTGEYEFHCGFPSELTEVGVGVFKSFPSLRELDAQWISPRGQGQSELTADAPTVTLGD